MAGRGLVVVRAVRPDEETVALVAERMRATLEEVLGDRGAGLYAIEWLRDRVRAHLDPARLDGSLFLAQDPRGACRGHLLARPERDGERTVGLIATVYVEPAARRSGAASLLFDAGEAWLRARGLDEVAYDTDAAHAAMARLLSRRGYAITHRATELAMVRWSRRY